MRHFMREGGEDGFIGAAGEAVPGYRPFVHSRFLDAAGKALRGEIASGLCVALQRHQHMGQGTAEQFRVEEVVSVLKSPVLSWCDRFFRGDSWFHGAVPFGLYLFVSYDTHRRNARAIL